MRLLTILSLLLLSAQAAAETKVELLNFTAGYCQPCQDMLPVLNRMQNAGFPIRKIDLVDSRNAPVVKGYRVELLPTYIVLLNGKVFRRFEGIQEEHLLRSTMLEAHAAGKAEENQSPPASRPSIEKLGLGILQPWRNRDNENEPLVTRGQNPDPSATEPLARAEAATVRVRVEGANRSTRENIVDLGSGTVIASKPGESLLLTCAHLFEDLSPADTRVTVECFRPDGPQVYPAEVICGSRYLDLVVLRIPTPRAIEAVPLSGDDVVPKPEQTLFSIGCNDGDRPSRTTTGLVTRDRYQDAPPHLICSGDPASGRSGGGLYDRRGNLLGICSAALREQQEGLFMGAGAVRQLLQEQKLTHLLPTNSAPAENTDPGEDNGSNKDQEDAFVFNESPAFDSRTSPMGSSRPLPEQDRMQSNAPLFSVPAAADRSVTRTETSAPARPAQDFAGAPDLPAKDLFAETSPEIGGSGTEIEVIINPRGPADQRRILRIPRASRWLLNLLTGEDEGLAENGPDLPAVAPEPVQSATARYADEAF